MRNSIAALAGLLFAVGLGIGGMTQPAKVIGFLDFAGDWDPSLAFVMLGAIGVHALALRWILRRRAPVFADRFFLAKRDGVDRRLVLGAAIFGVGWGLAGYCPGPGIVALGAGVRAAWVFVPAMLCGMWLERVFVEDEAGSGVAAGKRARAAAPASQALGRTAPPRT